MVIDWPTGLAPRALMAALSSLLFVLILGGPMIRMLARFQLREVVREDGPKQHFHKAGTPTMGGMLIVVGVTLAVACWGRWDGVAMPVLCVTLWSHALLGFWDDACKCFGKARKGLKARSKALVQLLVALALMLWVYHAATLPAQTALHLPWAKQLLLPMGSSFVVFGLFVLVGTGNAVNLTDGLDGLAVVPVAMVALALALLGYLASEPMMAKSLMLPVVPGTADVVIFAMAVVGAGMGFLWFNGQPAQVFMGDLGALSLGSVLGMIALLLRQELLLAVMGGVFVAEAISVILQVGSFRLRGGKRIFLMAPLHHHFELKGWSESRVVLRFWWFTALLVMLALASLCWH